VEGGYEMTVVVVLLLWTFLSSQETGG